MHRRVLAASALLCQFSHAQMAPFDYDLGAVRVTEDAAHIVVHASTPIGIEIFNGGHTWPLFSLDEEGRIYAGSVVVDPATGNGLRDGFDEAKHALALPYGVSVAVSPRGYRINQGRASCFLSARQLGINRDDTTLEILKNGNVVFAASSREVVALATQFNREGNVGRYLATRLQLDRCKSTQTNLGKPDLLVELNASRKGGWWITGSIEQTLLRSDDGTRWRKMALPEALSSLISSYVVDAKEVWLAAYMGGDIEVQPGIVYSADGGKHWQTLRKDDPLLVRLPKGWLEGYKRRQAIE